MKLLQVRDIRDIVLYLPTMIIAVHHTNKIPRYCIRKTRIFVDDKTTVIYVNVLKPLLVYKAYIYLL